MAADQPNASQSVAAATGVPMSKLRAASVTGRERLVLGDPPQPGGEGVGGDETAAQERQQRQGHG